MDRIERLNVEQIEELSLLDTLFNSAQGSILAMNALYLVVAVCGYGFFLFLTRQTLIVASRKVEYDLRNDVYMPYSACLPFFIPNIQRAKFTFERRKISTKYRNILGQLLCIVLIRSQELVLLLL